MKKKVVKNWKWYVLGLIILTIIVTWLIINKTVPKAYDIGACTINNYECASASWDGNCTGEMVDECCEDTIDVRMCGGHVDDWTDCYDKYCETAGYKCEAVTQIQGGYDCVCKPVDYPI